MRALTLPLLTPLLLTLLLPTPLLLTPLLLTLLLLTLLLLSSNLSDELKLKAIEGCPVKDIPHFFFPCKV